MPKLVITINRDNEATKGIDGLPEIGRILQELADNCKNCCVQSSMTLLDVNGNTAGEARFVR